MLRPHTSVYYHDDPDGIFSAYAARLMYGEQAEYVPWRAGVPLPREPDRDVIVLDLGLTAETLAALAQASRTLQVVDHHASSGPAYVGLAAPPEKVRIVFDPQQAACVLAWRHFRPADKVPEIVQYVADRDLWRWQLPHSREINHAIGLRVCGAANVWEQVEICLHSKGLLLNEGEVLTRYVARQAERLAAQAHAMKFPPAADSGWAEPAPDIPCVNADRAFVSEVGERLLELYPAAPFVACWQDTPDERTWELRSRPSGFDVGAYARSQGGGGHQTAAGFRIKLPGVTALDRVAPLETATAPSETHPPPGETIGGESETQPAAERKRKRA